MKELIAAFDLRPLVQDDVDEFVYEFDLDLNAIYIPKEFKVKGFYDAKTDAICVCQRLRGAERLETCWHELIHYSLHYPVQRRPWEPDAPPPTKPPFTLNDRFECEAKALALVAVVPLWMLLEFDADRLYYEWDIRHAMLLRRWAVYEKHGI